MHTFRTTLISSRFSLGIFVFMLTCSLFDTSYASSRKIPPSDVIELIRKYRAAQDTTGEERAARALAFYLYLIMLFIVFVLSDLSSCE